MKNKKNQIEVPSLCMSNDKKSQESIMLSSQFKIKTNWYVITGAPSSGKTTVINMLEGQGFKVIHEVARQFITEKLEQGITIDEIRDNRVSFQRELLQAKQNIENSLQPQTKMFLDRALPDSLTYYRLNGLDPNDILAHCLQYQYAKVFFLEKLPFQEDDVRTENEESANYLNQWLKHDYESLGYQVINVPVMQPSERVRFILNKI